jgi:iron complex outermembrane recepter protein
MKKCLKFLFMATFTLFPLEMTGQGEIIIKGKVKDHSGYPLIYANVTIVDESCGGSTDRNGGFFIKLPSDYINKNVVLEVRYIGFISQSKEIKLLEGTNIYDFQLEKDVLSLKPIIVTAQRREEYLQNVPISITTMSNNDIKNRGIDRVMDLQNSVPNFFLGDDTFNRSAASSIRGIAGSTRATGVEKRANYYIDDVYVGRSIAVNMDLFDLERIEILKGPQGTLFGKNTISGAINLTTRKPINELEATLSVDAGNFNYFNSNIIINTPLKDNVLLTRFSGKILRRDGFVTNLYNNKDLNGQNIMNGRFQVRYLPSPNLDINLSLSALRDRRDRTVAIALDGQGYNAAPEPREVSHNYSEFEHRDMFGSALNMVYQFSNNYNIRSITAYRKIKNWGEFDIDLSPEPLYIGKITTEDAHFTQEIRLSSPLLEHFDFVTGLYYISQKSDQIDDARGSPEASIPNFIMLSYGPVRSNSLAGYFHSNINLMNNLSLFTGIRYTYEYKRINWTQINDPYPYVNLQNYTDKYSKGIFSPQIGVRYKILDQLMSYGKITWGYKSGGWGNHSVLILEHLKLRPEYAISYEMGVKLTTFNDRLSFNSAIFLSKFDDYQTEVWQDDRFGSTHPIYMNAAKVTSKGFEIELIAAPMKNLSLFNSFGYVNATYDEFDSAPRYDYTGNKLELAPETEYNFSIEYRLPVTNIGTFSIRGDFIHKDDYFFDASNSEDFLVEGYELIDGKIGYESSDGSLRIFLWGKNMTDKLYMLTRAMMPEPTKYAWYGIPRTFGIQVSYNFFN